MATLINNGTLPNFDFNVAEGHQNILFHFEAAKPDKGGSQFFVF